jgi:hypothetical protein
LRKKRRYRAENKRRAWETGRTRKSSRRGRRGRRGRQRSSGPAGISCRKVSKGREVTTVQGETGETGEAEETRTRMVGAETGGKGAANVNVGVIDSKDDIVEELAWRKAAQQAGKSRSEEDPPSPKAEALDELKAGRRRRTKKQQTDRRRTKM